MLATRIALTEPRNVQLRCGACRYFLHDRCSHSSARLDEQETKTGECPYFRFSHGHQVGY
ncbi:hypothetical protein A6A04_16630 [Paramagnetospirillum marisnigri]|uniref:Uncharacterized protein n=1 Tax=Paramagnetospirillum marisnigri TaxID=1285242 RepID=A0A178MSH0_9PROT|nr:hypothetical protein [Paramagnetospirillum marisnigri]OAN51275.1 hypothetical protein A6A04_16630 [Paramagnetospirillum marisnigri]